jgi:O-antigen/teichoic acid export membrane protein
MLVKSTEVLGYFTIAIQVGSFVRQIPLAFGMVLYPQMAHTYGENHSAMDVWRLSRKAAFAASALGLVAGICGWLLLPTFVRLVLPKYVAGIRAAQWAGFLGFAMGFYLFDSVYNIIKRQDLYFYNWCAGCSTFVAAWYCLTRLLHVPLAVASSQSMLLATFVMAIVSAFVGKTASMAHDRRLEAQRSRTAGSAAPTEEA